MNWLLVLMLLCHPGLRINPEWHHTLGEATVVGHYMDPRGRIGWYNAERREIHVVYTLAGDREDMLRRISHETHHYLAKTSGLGDWDKFARLALNDCKRNGCSGHQIKAIKGMIAYGGGYELHAELPWILEGEIPGVLQPWYPWYDLGGPKAKGTRWAD